MNDGVLHRVFDQLSTLVEAGGFVMWPLLAVGILSWTLLLLRIMTLIEIKQAPKKVDLESKLAHSFTTNALTYRLWQDALRRHGAIIDTLVAAAPLLGLLGTVSGMIATFDGLTTMTLFSESGGIAGGISEALTTTQAGLLVAIPAFFANRVIGRKAAKQIQRLDAAQIATQKSVRRVAS
ncbi:MAG: MotA/TolQ/ExbB proton channel family protein [Deltaproteobacteria bacterium]|nr:MotA/TolQ/ExbB proton channel family protein [Deltaproteobacteria bacterium]